MSMDETEEILAIIKKTLSGTIGKNLIDIPFPTSAVANSEEHKMLMKLRETRLEDEECVKAFLEDAFKRSRKFFKRVVYVVKSKANDNKVGAMRRYNGIDSANRL